MKIGELRQALANHDDDILEAIIVELYKVLPKKVKDEKEIDRLIYDPANYTKRTKSRRDEAQQLPNIEALSKEVETFIEYAGQQYYLAPNQVVPKKERPKWRFTVKRLYKQIIEAAAIPEYRFRAAILLESLYKLLSYACHYVLFTTEEPFASVGVPQLEFLRSIFAIRLQDKISDQDIIDMISLIVEQPIDGMTYHTDLIVSLLEFLKTSAHVTTAIKQCEVMIQASKAKGTASSSRRRSFSDDYEQDVKLKRLAELGFLGHVVLNQFKQGSDFFWQHYPDNEEAKLYIMLDRLYDLQEWPEWIRIYEDALQKGIKPRRELQNMYETVVGSEKLK